MCLKHLVLVFICLPILSGCLAAAAAGGAAAGYYVGQDERSMGQITDDAVISSSVKTRLIGDGEVAARHINVDVRNQVVSLHGSVASQEEKDKAVEIARSTRGVTRVVSYLEVRTAAVEDRS